MNKQRKYQKPSFLPEYVSQADYEKWLYGKASAHLRRDKKRGNRISTAEEYRIEIHRAVDECHGHDAYTGKPLRWDLLHTYDNEESKKHGRKYKARFADLPTVDHLDDGKGKPSFKICSWKVNDAKNDLTLEEFIELCQSVLSFNQRH